MTMTLREVHDRVRELAWRPDAELRGALSNLFEELEDAVEEERADDEDDNGTSTALARREPDLAEVEAANTLARLEAEREEYRQLVEEYKLRLHHESNVNRTLESTLIEVQATCEALRGERDRAIADALAARGETFSKLIDREIELRLQPDMGEDEVRRVSQLLDEKNAALNVLQCHKEAAQVATALVALSSSAAGVSIDRCRQTQLIVGVRDQQTWTFALPTKMALFYLEVVAAAWIRTVDARYNEIMSKHRVASENEDD